MYTQAQHTHTHTHTHHMHNQIVFAILLTGLICVFHTLQPVEEDLEEDEEFVAVDTYANYKPAKCK